MTTGPLEVCVVTGFVLGGGCKDVFSVRARFRGRDVGGLAVFLRFRVCVFCARDRFSCIARSPCLA